MHAADRHQLRFLPPDHVNERAGNHLLIWGDIPHWMVLDSEFRDFLQAFDGSRSVADAISVAGNATAPKVLRDQVVVLSERGEKGDILLLQ